MGVGFVRRTYARRLVKFMDKSKTRKRPLPPELREVSIAMSRLPEDQRLPALEDALAGKGPEAMSRDMRRAASRQQRMSGKGGPHRRPGAVRTRDPVSQPGAPAPAKPAPAKPASAKAKRPPKPGATAGAGRSRSSAKPPSARRPK